MMVVIFDDEEYEELMGYLEWVRRNCPNMKWKIARDVLAHRTERIMEILKEEEK